MVNSEILVIKKYFLTVPLLFKCHYFKQCAMIAIPQNNELI